MARNRFDRFVAGPAIVFVCLTRTAGAQAPAPAAPAGGPAVAAPTYISIPLEIAIDRPAAEVWKRVGKYCDIGDGLRIACTITSAKYGEVGSVATVSTEMLFGNSKPT